MSFDLLIATKTPPTRAMVESHLRQTGWRLLLAGDLAGDSANLLAESRRLFQRRPVFVLSGPYPAEHEDLPDPVQQAIRGRAFLLEMNVPWSLSSKDFMRAFALCEHLARSCDGVVFDPQEDQVVFPAAGGRSQRSQPRLTPIRELTLEWYLAQSAPPDADRFLDVTRRTWPAATPTRFGTHEPLRFKIADPPGDAAFRDLWHPATRFFFWKSKEPVLGGSIFWSPDGPEPPGQRRRVALSVHIDASAVGRDADMCDRAVDFFAAVAQELGAFFAAGYVTRGALKGKRGALWSGPDTENFAFDWVAGPWWFGVPRKATWLTWFGEPYRDLVAPNLRGIAQERGRGLLVRLGPAPMDSDEVLPHAPTLPAALLVGMRPVLGKVPMKDTGEPMVLYYERSPASVIPAFD